MPMSYSLGTTSPPSTHDRRTLPVLWRVEGGLGEHDVVLLGLTPEVLEQTLLPHALHVIPVLGGNQK